MNPSHLPSNCLSLDALSEITWLLRSHVELVQRGAGIALIDYLNWSHIAMCDNLQRKKCSSEPYVDIFSKYLLEMKL